MEQDQWNFIIGCVSDDLDRARDHLTRAQGLVDVVAGEMPPAFIEDLATVTGLCAGLTQAVQGRTATSSKPVSYRSETGTTP